MKTKFEDFVSEQNISINEGQVLDGQSLYQTKIALDAIENAVKLFKAREGKSFPNIGSGKFADAKNDLEIIHKQLAQFVKFWSSKSLTESEEVNEENIGPFSFSIDTEDQDLIKDYYEALSGHASWQKSYLYPKSVYKTAMDKAAKILKSRGINADDAVRRLNDLKI